MNVRQFDKNIKSKFTYLPSHLPGMKVIRKDNLLLINSNLKSDMFNIICCEENIERSALKKCLEYFKSKHLPYAFWIGFEDDPEWLENDLITHGLITEEMEWAMACDLKSNNHKLMSNSMEIRQLNSENELQNLIQVMNRILPENEHLAIKSFYTQSQDVLLSKNSSLRFYIGYENNQPISLSSLYCDENLASIFDVIVLPEMRGKGLGKMMTLTTMLDAKERGYSSCVLTATNDAKFVYERLGFNTFKTMKVYREL